MFGKNLSMQTSFTFPLKSNRPDVWKFSGNFFRQKIFLWKIQKQIILFARFFLQLLSLVWPSPCLSLCYVRVDLFGIRKAKRTNQRKDREKSTQRNQQSYYIEWQRLSDWATHKGNEWENLIEKKNQSGASQQNAVWIIFVGFKKRYGHTASHRITQKTEKQIILLNWIVEDKSDLRQIISCFRYVYFQFLKEIALVLNDSIVTSPAHALCTHESSNTFYWLHFVSVFSFESSFHCFFLNKHLFWTKKTLFFIW